METQNFPRPRRSRPKSAQLSSGILRNTHSSAFYFPTPLGPPASIHTHNGRTGSRLPLDILSSIIGYLWESPADLATISRVSRILHYLATPLLYREVRLRGFGTRAGGPVVGDEARDTQGRKRKRDSGDYVDQDSFSDLSGRYTIDNGNGAAQTPSESGVSAGNGGGMTVFLVGLATLQRPTVSKVVKKLVLEGELEMGSFGLDGSKTIDAPKALNWTESDGMFGLAVGGTVNTLTDLQEFSWQLNNTYIHPMLWYCLARHPTLNTLTYVCPPSATLPPPSRIPTTFVPSFQHLTSLSVLDIDGSQPPDDFSRIVFCSPGIEQLTTLRLSWVDGEDYGKQKGIGGGLGHVFGARVRSITAGKQSTIKKLGLKTLELMNLYIPPGDLTMEQLFDATTIEHLTYLNCSIFDSWPSIFSATPPPTHTVASSPTNSLSPPTTSSSPSINSSTRPHQPNNPLPSLHTFRTDSLHPPTLHLLSHTHHLRNIYLLPPPQPLRPIPTPLRESILAILDKNHLPTIHRLLLPPHLILSKSDCSKLIRNSPPTIIELGLACDRQQWSYLIVLIPFLANITCFRVLRAKEIQPLTNPSNGLFGASPPEVEKMERRMADGWRSSTLRVLGVGSVFWRVDRVISVEAKMRVWGGGGGMDGPDLMLPSQRVKRGARVDELYREMEADKQQEEEAGGVWEGGDLEGEWGGREMAGEGEGELEEKLRRLDEEFKRRETEGDIPKRKTQRVNVEEVLDVGIVREGVYGLAR